MNQGKVILAALVIFAAGVVTGGLTVRLKVSEPPQPTISVASGSNRQRAELLDRMQRQLYLTPEQRSRVDVILRESHERMKQLWESIAPQAQEERRRVNDLIRAELLPEQRTRFEEMLKSRSLGRGLEDRRRRDPRSPRKADQTNRATALPEKAGSRSGLPQP